MINESFFKFISRYKFFIKIFIALLLLFYVFSIIDMSSILGILKKTNIKILVPAFVLAVFNQIFISNQKWSVILKSYNSFIPFRDLCSMYLKGMFLSMFLPGTYGGDFVRAYKVSSYTRSKAEGIMSVVLERGTGLIGMVLIFLTTVAVLPDAVPEQIRTWGVFLSLIFIFASAPLFSERFVKFIHDFSGITGGRISSIIKEVLESISSIKGKTLLLVFSYSITFQLLVIFTNYLIALSIGVNISFIYFLVAIPIVSLLSMIPVSFNGIGIRDISYIGILGLYGIDKEVAFSIGIIAFAMGVMMSLYGGALYIREH